MLCMWQIKPEYVHHIYCLEQNQKFIIKILEVRKSLRLLLSLSLYVYSERERERESGFNVHAELCV